MTWQAVQGLVVWTLWGFWFSDWQAQAKVLGPLCKHR